MIHTCSSIQNNQAPSSLAVNIVQVDGLDCTPSYEHKTCWILDQPS
jgi:hypothetical protein